MLYGGLGIFGIILVMALLAIAYGMRRENESSSIQKNIHENMTPESILLQQQQEDFTEPSGDLIFSSNQEKDVDNFDSQKCVNSTKLSN